MRAYFRLLLPAVAVTLSGCGWLFGNEGYFRDRGDDYREYQRTTSAFFPWPPRA